MTVFDNPLHKESERLQESAEQAERAGSTHEARKLYEVAASRATLMVDETVDQPQVRSVLAVRAVALWLKADRPDKVEGFAKEWLEADFLSPSDREHIRQLDETAWKRRVIAQDISGFAQRARAAGYEVVVHPPMTPEENLAEWEARAPNIKAANILPAFAQLLAKDGKQGVIYAVLMLKELRPDLHPAINEAVKKLKLTRVVQRAELKHIDTIWKRTLGPALTIEHLRPMIQAIHEKSMGALAAWVQRVRKHRPDLVPPMVAILRELGLS